MDTRTRPVERWRLAAGVVLVLAGATTAVLATTSILPALHRVDDALRQPGAWQRYGILDSPEGGFRLGQDGPHVVVAGVILAAVGVVLALNIGGRARLLLGGAAAGSAIYLLAPAQPWMSRALPAWITPFMATLPVVLGVAAVLLALTVVPTSDPTRRRIRAITVVAVGVAVAALDWWRFQFPSGTGVVALLVVGLLPPVLLCGIVVACAWGAGLRRRRLRWWAYAVLGVLLPFFALVVEFFALVYNLSASASLEYGPVLGALLAAITTLSLHSRQAGTARDLEAVTP